MPATLIEWRWLDKPPGQLLINLTPRRLDSRLPHPPLPGGRAAPPGRGKRIDRLSPRQYLRQDADPACQSYRVVLGLQSPRSRYRRSDHTVLLLGPPGAGTSMLARRLTTILPAMTLAEALETTRIHRVAGLTGDRTALVTTRPFRAPHHTISDAGLIGGGRVPMPGEVSLA
jgi:hypothetical protein